MSIFILRDGKVQIETENLTIPEFKIIYERDKSKDKSVAFNELCYIYHIADYKSIYNNYDDIEKESKVLNDYFKGSNWRPDEIVKEASKRYNELRETPSMRLLKATRKALSKVVDYFNTVDLNERDAKGAIVNRIGDLTGSAGNVGKLVESLDKVEEKIKKEQLKESKVRGQADITSYERTS